MSIDKQKIAAEFCGVCWHEDSGETRMYGAGDYPTPWPICICGELYSPDDRCRNPDFSGKDFHLLHDTMTKKRKWDYLYYWLKAKQGMRGRTLTGMVARNFHQLPFAEQFEIIVEYLSERGE